MQRQSTGFVQEGKCIRQALLKSSSPWEQDWLDLVAITQQNSLGWFCSLSPGLVFAARRESSSQILPCIYRLPCGFLVQRHGNYSVPSMYFLMCNEGQKTVQKSQLRVKEGMLCSSEHSNKCWHFILSKIYLIRHTCGIGSVGH